MASIRLNWIWLYWNHDQKSWAKNILPQIINSGIQEADTTRVVYVIRLNGSFAIEYPKGISSVIYVGEGNLRARLNHHGRTWLNELQELAQFSGFTIGFCTPRVRNNMTAYKDVEAAIISEFALLYGTAPLNNKQYESKRIQHEFDIQDINLALKIGKGIRHKWAIKPIKSNMFYDYYHRTNI